MTNIAGSYYQAVGTTQIGNSVVVVPAGAALDTYIVNNPNAKVFLLDPSTNGLAGGQTLDVSKLPATVTGITIRGGAPRGGLTNWEAFAAVTVPTKCWAIIITKTPTSANAVAFIGCHWEDLAITAPTNLGNTYTHVLCNGRTNADNTFTRVGVVDCTVGITKANSGTTRLFECATGETGALAVSWPDPSVGAPKSGTAFMDITATASATIQINYNAAGATNLIANAVSGTTYRVIIKAVTAGDTFTLTNSPTVLATSVVDDNCGNFLTDLNLKVDGKFIATGHFIAGIFGVSAAGSDNNAVTYGTWDFDDLYVYSSGSELVVDSEFSSATVGATIRVKNAYLRDVELVALVNTPYVSVGRVKQRVSTTRGYNFNAGSPLVAGGPTNCPVARTFTVANTAGNNPGFGEAIFDDVTVVQDDTAANGPQCNQVWIITGSAGNAPINTYYFKRFEVKKQLLYLNGNTTTGIPINIQINSAATAAATWADEIIFGETTFGYTSTPTTPTPLMRFSAASDGVHVNTANIVRPGKIRALPATAAYADFPATVAGTVITYPVAFGIAGDSDTFADVVLDDIDVSAISGSWTATTPALFTLVNSPVMTRFFYGPKNSNAAAAGGRLGSLFNELQAQSSLVTIGNLLNYTPPSDGLFEVSGGVAIVTLGSASISKRVSFTDENGTTHSAYILGTVNPTTGTSPAGGVATAAQVWGYDAIYLWVKGGTNLQVFDGGTTATSYDSWAYIRQIA